MGKYQNEKIKVSDVVTEIYVTEDNNIATKRLTYKIDKSIKTIIFFPKPDDFFLDKISIEGFENLPDEFSVNGYLKQGVQYHLNKKLENKKIVSLLISKDKSSSIKKYRKSDSLILTLNYSDFSNLKSSFYTINQEGGKQKSDTVSEFFYRLFPKHFEEKTDTSKEQYSKVLKNLNSNIIEHFQPEDLGKFEKFLIDLLETKYKTKHHRFLQLARTKIEVDTVAVDRILADFEECLKKGQSEKEWGKFLLRNLFLLDSKYVKVIPEINLVLGGERYVDFGMIDTKGYLDIFEIKTPETDLLAANTDRGNYYWHTDTVKALMQAEKYLHRAERKASTLAEDLKEEKKVNVKVLKPRAFLIIGHSNQLDSDNKQNDFRVLRSSLKNVEIILYDELLEGLENQKNKYIDQILIDKK